MLRFPNVSSQHCQLTLENGYWFLKDLNSRNGCKVNDNRVTEKRLDPGDTVSIAKHKYEVRYSPEALGATGPPPDDNAMDIFSKSLLERAGLAKTPGARQPASGRFDVRNMDAGQIRNPFKPL